MHDTAVAGTRRAFEFERFAIRHRNSIDQLPQSVLFLIREIEREDQIVVFDMPGIADPFLQFPELFFDGAVQLFCFFGFGIVAVTVTHRQPELS